MNIVYLHDHFHLLLNYLRVNGYVPGYIRQIKAAVFWILTNEKFHSWQSYQDAYQERISSAKSEFTKKGLRLVFGVIERFDLYGEFPNRRRSKNSFIKRGFYHHLTFEFKELIDFYKVSCNLNESTVSGNASSAASFLYAMQQRGITRLEHIQEEDVLSFFLDNNGNISKGIGPKQSIATVFKRAIDWKEKECRAILTYLPPIRARRKTVQFLTSDEVASIRKVLHEENSALSLRDRAILTLMFYTGVRSCDVVAMTLCSVHWESDEIRLFQQKTGQPLILPLTAIVGNAIWSYLTGERPESNNNHLFLTVFYPHHPLSTGATRHITDKLFREAGIRQGKDDRRGTHLFRHNVATFFLGSEIPRPVISQILGHDCPLSLDPYLHADLVNLKACALSIEKFSVCEEVFK